MTVFLDICYAPLLHNDIARWRPDPTMQFKPSVEAFLYTVLLQELQSQVGPLVDIVLSPAPDEENAASVGMFLDHCEKQSGTGATLALGLLDMVWSLPAPIRPKLGDWVFAAVFEALRRYGVFTRYRRRSKGVP